MHNQFYIDVAGQKDGPHDLVTIMRRIRAHKIDMDTRVFVDDATSSRPAKEVPELEVFFTHSKTASPGQTEKLFTLSSVVREGWSFTMHHNIMTVFAGGIVLVSILLLISMVKVLGPAFGTMLAWIIFMIFQYMYLIFSLRLTRGQPISVDFMNNKLSPVLSTVLLGAFCYAMMIAGGFMLLIIPAILVGIYYIFVPLFIIDRKMSVLEAMYASRLLGVKCGGKYHHTIFFIMLAYLGSIILIAPLPLTMPIFSAALIKIYEELTAA